MLRIDSEITDLCSTEEGRATAIGFLPTIFDNIKGLDQKIARHLFTVALLCLAFELLARSSIGTISISGIQITEYSMIERFLPALIAYLTFSSWSLVAARRLLEELHDKIIERVYTKLWQKDLELFLRPPHMIKTYSALQRENGGCMGLALEWSVKPIVLVLFLSIPIFLIYSWWTIFSKFGLWDFLTIFSFFISFFFFLQTFLISAALTAAVAIPPAAADVQTSSEPIESPKAPDVGSGDNVG